MSTITETIKEWLATDKTGNLIADQFEEIVIRECADEEDVTPQVYVFVSDHKTGFKNTILIAANGDYKDRKGADGVIYWLKEQYRYVVDYLKDESKYHPDNVNHPNHYASKGDNEIECIDAIAAATYNLQGEEAFCIGNAIKYLWRYREKNGREDLKKAIWYINRVNDIMVLEEDT